MKLQFKGTTASEHATRVAECHSAHHSGLALLLVYRYSEHNKINVLLHMSTYIPGDAKHSIMPESSHRECFRLISCEPFTLKRLGYQWLKLLILQVLDTIKPATSTAHQ